MTGRRFASRARRVLRKPPRVIAARAYDELRGEAERFLAPRRAGRLDEERLLRIVAAPSLDALWERTRARTLFTPLEANALETLEPGETDRVRAAAEATLQGRVALLGGETVLGRPIEWHTDFKSGRSWPQEFWRSIRYVHPDDDSDVKVPWELSRLQWAIPVGQAFALMHDERYARTVRDVLDDWLLQNPYGVGVNWAVTMEAALRIFSWSWLLGALGGSDAWSEHSFRSRLLRGLYLHGDFTARNLERSDVNGNHYTADAAGLQAAGLLFEVEEWVERGWRILCAELPRQVHTDGVDFEASSAYHRLVGELFFLAALQRERLGLAVPDSYREHVTKMARFTTAYTQPDGTAPHWGDADDARALPLGGHTTIEDHRHFPSVVAAAWRDPDLVRRAACGRAEAAWLLGTNPASVLGSAPTSTESRAFPAGGAYVLGDGDSHVFVDAGPIGLAGRGGHGHNDCLSFEAVLAGTRLVVDCGSYVYTRSFEWRNRFRSTAYHNTPIVDHAEQNRYDPENLWRLEDDTAPEVTSWSAKSGRARLSARHLGYRRLPDPVTVERTVSWDATTCSLAIHDRFEAHELHHVEVPIHLAPGVRAVADGDGRWLLHARERSFVLAFSDPRDWTTMHGNGWFSPRYGVKTSVVRLSFAREGHVRPLTVVLAPPTTLEDALRAHEVP